MMFEVSLNHTVTTSIVCIGLVALFLILGTQKTTEEANVFHVPAMWGGYDSGHGSSVNANKSYGKQEETSTAAMIFPKKFNASHAKLNTICKINGSYGNVENSEKQERIISGYLGEKLPHENPHVVYIWCGTRIFTFRNYLSAKSVIHFIQPPVITFVYEHYPLVDVEYYNMWINDLKQDFPFWEEKEYAPGTLAACHCGDNSSLIGIKQVVEELHQQINYRGRTLYFAPNTVLTQPFQYDHYNNSSHVELLSNQTSNGYVLLSDNGGTVVYECQKHILRTS